MRQPTNTMSKNGPLGLEIWHSYDGGKTWEMVSQEIDKKRFK